MWIVLLSFLVGALLVSAEVRRRARNGIRREAKSWKDRVDANAYSKVSRDVASHDLWEHIRGDFWFVLLRRLTGIAPLVGVLTSALAFWLVDGTSVESIDAGGMEVLQSLRPAFSGVVIGAFWAIANQIIVLYVEHWAQVQADSAIASCDADKIGSDNGLPKHLETKLYNFGWAVATSYDALVAMQERFASNASEAFERYIEGAGRLEASATVAAERLEVASRVHFETMGQVTAQYVKVVTSMTNQLEKLDAKITQYLTDAADANLSARDGVKAALDEASAIVARYRLEFERSLNSWSDSAERQVEAWKAISVAASEESVAEIRATVRGLALSMTTAVEGLSASLARQQEVSIAHLSQSMNAFGGELSGGVNRLVNAAAGISDSSTTLSQMRSELGESLRELAMQTERMAKATEQMRDTSASIAARESSLALQAESSARQIEVVGNQFTMWATEVRAAQSRNAALFESATNRLHATMQQLRAPSTDAAVQSDANRGQ